MKHISKYIKNFVHTTFLLREMLRNTIFYIAIYSLFKVTKLVYILILVKDVVLKNIDKFKLCNL